MILNLWMLFYVVYKLIVKSEQHWICQLLKACNNTVKLPNYWFLVWKLTTSTIWLIFNWVGSICGCWVKVTKLHNVLTVRLFAANSTVAATPETMGQALTLTGARDAAEKSKIEQVLRDTNGSLMDAAGILDISRTTLWTKIQKYGIKVT